MHVLTLVFGILVGQADGKAIAVKTAIAKADRIVAGAALEEDCWENGTLAERCGAVVESLKTAGVFESPIKLTLDVRTLAAGDDGQTLSGRFRAREETVSYYFTDADRKTLAEFDAETKLETERHEAGLDATRKTRDDAARDRDQPRVDYYDRLILDIKKSFEREVTERRERERKAMLAEFSGRASPRKDAGEWVEVLVRIPETLAGGIDLQKLASAKKAPLTLKVESFTIRPPLVEIGKPAAIGSIEATLIEAGSTFKKK